LFFSVLTRRRWRGTGFRIDRGVPAFVVGIIWTVAGACGAASQWAAGELADRVGRGIDAVLSRTGPDAASVAVLHGGVIGEVCRQATGSRPFAFVHSDNCSLSRLVVLPDGRRLLRSFNDTAHLMGSTVSGSLVSARDD